MRVFVAGATGVIGRQLVPLLLAAGHEVAGMTRSTEKAPALHQLGAQPIVCDVFDAGALRAAVFSFEAEAVVHEVTDLPDDRARIPSHAVANARIRRQGTVNLLEAARAAGTAHFVAQSVAWPLPGDGGAAIEDLEQVVLDAEGVVLRYGQLYGPGTYYEADPPPPPRVHVAAAARQTVAAIGAPSGVIVVTEEPERT